MKKYLTTFLCLILCVSSLITFSFILEKDAKIDKRDESQYVPGEVIVGFISDVPCTSYMAVKLIEQNGGKVKEI